MKKLLYVSAGVVALSIFCARAEEAAPAAAPAPEKAKKERKHDVPPMPKPEMKELTLTGTVAKQEGKDKKDQVVVSYTLASDDGSTVKLPAPKGGKDGAPALKLEDFVGVKVKVTGLGGEKEAHGKKMSFIQKITNIEKLTDQAPAK